MYNVTIKGRYIIFASMKHTELCSRHTIDWSQCLYGFGVNFCTASDLFANSEVVIDEVHKTAQDKQCQQLTQSLLCIKSIMHFMDTYDALTSRCFYIH